MTFRYQYRTSGNELREGTLNAPNREAVYTILKLQRIRPVHVDEAPGFFNKLLGKGKRWIAIVFLSVLACGAVSWALSSKREVEDARREVEDAALYEARSQIYGAPGVLRALEREKWKSVFPDVFERCLAAFAVPGKLMDVADEQRQVIDGGLPKSLSNVTEVLSSDLAEIAQMKRMVNGMKKEAQAYISEGGTIGGYLERLVIRQKAEASIFSRAQMELRKSDDATIWQRRNRELRAMGLPMVEPTEKNEEK